MSLISYAQNFEDVMLWRALRHVSAGFYVDVGAAWPEQHSVSKAFYDAGWSGINIEPNPALYAALSAARPRDVNLNVAVGERSGRIRLHVIDDTGLSSVDEGIAQRHIQSGWQTTPREVDMARLTDILNAHLSAGQAIHFLKVDVEGLETQVLRGNDWHKYRPWIVLVEATQPMTQVASYSEWEPLLLDAGYAFAYADGLNRFYLAREHEGLQTHFSVPPNVFDDFVPAEQARLVARADAADARADAADARADAADARADHALALAASANARTQQAFAEQSRLADELARTYRSLSWRLTTPLRVCNPKRFVFAGLRWAGRRAMQHPGLVATVKPRLESWPWLWERLKRVVVYDGGSTQKDAAPYTTLVFPDFDLLFANGPLADQRGIGRVCREQFRQLQRLAGSAKGPAAPGTDQQAMRPRLHFYTSIHWCPEVLPPNSVVMIHDVTPLLFPQHFPKAVCEEWEGRYARIARQAERIVTISRANVQDVSRLLGVPPERISMVYNGVTALPAAREVDVKLPERPFLVFLGSDDHHKNLDIVLQAYAQLRDEAVDLVMIGDNRTCEPKVRALGLQERVHFLGKLDDGSVGYVLSRAKALVFPSLYEGFGLPPLEAALLGTPSLCSDRPAMNEIIDTGVIFCDPLKVQDWEQAIATAARGGIPAEGVQALKRKLEQDFSWEKSAKALQGILHEAATAGGLRS
ncbi:MAG: FkbM family methyltransferase [Acidovorax sp.]|uniref:FkbM family methyltransferase n=1 Tax=Acidovorax sp. TaxID=1872122 RepID=UPI0039E5AA8B